VTYAPNSNFVGDVPRDFAVQANQNLLKILLNNLLTNAVNYASGNSLSIRVRENAIYFENRADSFDLETPFQKNCRGENSLGIGLGLNLVKRLCSSFGWKVGLESEKSTFCIIISTSNQ